MPGNRFKAVTGYLLKSVLPVVAGLSILGLLIAWLAGAFSTSIEPGRNEVATRSLQSGQATDVVHEVTRDYIEEAVGTLKAAGRAEISARVLARIEEVAVSAGGLVDAGDLLIRLDDAELRAEIRKEMESTDGWENWFRHSSHDWNRIIIGRSNNSKYEGLDGQSVAAIAKAKGEDPWDTFFNLVRS